MIEIHDKTFEPYLSAKEIQETIDLMSTEMNFLEKENPLFIVILKGSFIFASDLLKALCFDGEVTFMQLKSYDGTNSTGNITDLTGLPANLENRTLVVLEDIIDTGNTLSYLNEQLLKENPNKIYYASLLLKPSVYKKDIKIDFIGKEIPNHFVVGYGLDYNELGRTLPEIYRLKNK